ncbi:MAG TPA: lipoyl(octanoyl) transferase LipB [Solirubrobacteraceae bacterium]|jgi:lipoyl(octanoyl) transferase
MNIVGRSSSDELWVCHLGTVPWREALEMQERLRTRRQAGELPDTLLLLEHPPVYTRGRRSRDGELALGEDFYRARGIEVVTTNRGGRVTYHGPGQLVGYPIMGVTDVLAHLRTIERALVAALAQEGIAARSRVDDGADYTGVWVGERKIASLGVHVSRGVSTHGFAVNVDNDLEPFSWVVACGLPDVEMTSVARELTPTHTTGMSCFRKRVAFQFCQAHGRRQRLASPRKIGAHPPAAPVASTRREAVMA